ncbi:MAG: LPS-assembly protein LptD [Chlamydiales bacterium]|nr:LPS-assembly protein LptD [Chlamydiales bacterium]
MPFFLLFLLFCVGYADELTFDPPMIWDADCDPCRPVEPLPYPIYEIDNQNVIVDLVDPIYENGVLTTESGGILTAPGLRIQAQHITYIRNDEGDEPIFTVTCEGNLLVDYKEWVLVGDSLYYDFTTNRGYLTNGRTSVPPWYIGGAEVLLIENGELIILDGFLTTSDGEVEDVVIRSPKIHLTHDKVVTASHINLRIQKVPIAWWPKLNMDLKNIGQSPFAVRFGWGGFLGSHLSLLYRFLSWGDLTATARIDGFIGKGLGGGIETIYDPKWRPTKFYSRSYYASDIPLDDPQRRNRYRFQGTYSDKFYGTSIKGIYDFVSDAKMASDYQTKDFDLKTAGRTQLEMRKATNAWIANLFTRVRVTNFQSVNQELPSLQLHWHTFEIPHTGILVENTFKASYLSYVFSDDIKKASDFGSSRVATHPFFYRPFYLGPLTLTPEAGFVGIGYNNSPNQGGTAGLAFGEFGLKLESAISKSTSRWKHVAEPYLHYNYLTAPSVPLDRHYIFTINDGWDRYNVIRFGMRNSLFIQSVCGIERPLWIDLWANAFINTPTIPLTIPRGYLNLEWQPFERIYCHLEGGWLFFKQKLDYYNARVDWTVGQNLAFSAEYRHRSKYDWRKADFYNFMLESVREQQELLDSPLSDKRDTALFRIFTRINPDWTAKFDMRYGWNREVQDHYLEYQIEATTLIFQHWRLTFIYDKREADNRYSVSFLLDPGPPPKRKACYK